MKIKIILLLVISFFLVGCSSKDNIKFKEEYESLNGKITNNNNYYSVLNINKKNNIKYKTDSEMVDIIKNSKENAVIYFGFATCPWCRTMVENLIDVTNALNIKNVYYVDIYDIRNSLSVADNNQIITTQMGSVSYYELVDLLKDYLDDYTITDKDNSIINTNTKRIYAPNVVAISNGKVVGLVDGISDSIINPYSAITDEIKKESYDELNNLISKISSNVCGINDKC